MKPTVLCVLLMSSCLTAYSSIQAREIAQTLPTPQNPRSPSPNSSYCKGYEEGFFAGFDAGYLGRPYNPNPVNLRNLKR